MNPKDCSPSEAISSWVDGRFSPRSGFYAGRGPSVGDLNSRILEMFYQGILRDVGAEAAKNFVRFVDQLKDLSASAFIVAFEQFWLNECNVVQIGQEARDRFRLSGHGDALIVEAFCTIGAALGGPSAGAGSDEIEHLSWPIKAEFVSRHRAELDGQMTLPKPFETYRL